MSNPLKILTLAACCFASQYSYALCTASDVNVTFLKNTLVQRDVSVGTIIGLAKVNSTITCDAEGRGTGDGSWYVQLSPANLDNGPSTIAGVRATNLAGVGIRWQNQSSNTGTIGTPTNNPLNSSSWRRGISLEGATTFTDTFDLIKTDSTPRTGIVEPLILNMQYSTPVSTSVVREPLFKYIIAGTNVNTVSCQVIDKNLNIDLGIAIMTKFKGVGSTLNPVNFDISLDCDENASVNFTLDNVSDIADAANGVLNLSSSSTAKGVGIQVKYNDAPVQFGKMVKHAVASSTGQIMKIPFTASYYKTSADVTPGSVIATASFTMTYR